MIGDGQSSIKKLIEKESEFRLKSTKIISLPSLLIDPECMSTLKQQGLRLNSIPERGKRIQVKSVVNQNRCDENESVRKQVHPEKIKLGAEAACELNIHLAGVDFMAPDIARPLRCERWVALLTK